MKHQVISLLGAVLVLALVAVSAGTVSSQSATATAAATPCPTAAATQASTAIASPATDPTTQSATAVPTAAATPDLSEFADVDIFAKFADQLAQSQHQTVKSSDGKLTLLIPPGALPADTPASKLKLSPLNPATTPAIDCGQVMLAYQLNPDGLKFVTPAVAVLTIDPPKDGHHPWLFSVSGQTVEPLSPVLYSTDPKTNKLVITAPIAHFSDMAYGGLSANVTVTLSDGSEHAFNDPFDATVTVTRPVVRAAGAVGSTTRTEGTWHVDGVWPAGLYPPTVLPRAAVAGPAEIDADTYTAHQQFECAGSSSTPLAIDVYFSAEIGLGQTRITGGEFGYTPLTCVPLATRLDVSFKWPVTTYIVTAKDPHGDQLDYTWDNSNTEDNGKVCGDFIPIGSVAFWSHPDSLLPHACPQEPVHPGTISVIVSDGHGAQQEVKWKNGSAPGTLTIK